MSEAQLGGLPRIESAFQPILSLAHGMPVGYEALLRATHDGQSCSPERAFAVARAAGQYGAYERASVAHHARRFAGFADRDEVLFVNLHPDVLIDAWHGPALVDDILACGVPPGRIVVEILEAREETTASLAQAVARLRACGVLIALDDFGAGLTNLGRVWDLRPDVVKLDRELICKAAGSYRNARSLLRLTDLLHDIGTFVVVEGIENEEQAQLAVDCDADFVQGYYFGRPALDVERAPPVSHANYVFGTRAASARTLRHVSDFEALQPYREAFAAMTEAFCTGQTLPRSATRFLELEWSSRVYVLDGEGAQIDEHLESERLAAWRRTTFPLLERRAGANWSKRGYFRNALLHPGEILVSEPYMSSTSTNLCVTLSVCVARPSGCCVLCADVLFEGLVRTLR
jgi:EAL domain-containing protein (putative c-di-GMP-specific phosphodiesterase class I)